MPYDTYRLYQAERATSYAGTRHADEQAGRLAFVMSSLLRGITRHAPAMRTPDPAAAAARGVPRTAGPARGRARVLHPGR